MKTSILLLILLLPFYSFSEKTVFQKVQELEKKLPKIAGKEKIDALNKMASLLTESNPESSIKYANAAFELEKSLNYPQGRAETFFNLGDAYLIKREINKALTNYDKALNIYKRTKNIDRISETLDKIGKTYRSISDYDTALDYFLKALKFSQGMKGKKKKDRMSLIFYQIGTVYQGLGDSDKALEYLKKSLDLAEKIGSKYMTAYALNNIGGIFSSNKNYHGALEYYKKASGIFKEINDQKGICTALINIGRTYMILSKFEQSLKFYQETLKKSKKHNFRRISCTTLFTMGELFFKNRNFKKALNYYNESLKKAKNFKMNNLIYNIYQAYSDLYVSMGSYQKALEYYKLYSELSHTLINKEKNREVAKLQEKYEAKERLHQIEILEKDKSIRIIIQIALLAISIILMILFFIFAKKYIHLFTFWKKEKYIGQYRLIEPIGFGGMSNVFKAHPVRDRSSVIAIKILREELFKIDSNKKRFRREGFIVDQLKHPNILEVYERGEIDERMYIAMEYIEGRTLEKEIDTMSPIPLDVCLHIMIQITDALAMIHGKEIVHRDLKPANIMLSRRDRDNHFVKLLDFGVSKLKYHSRLTQTGFLVGTLGYHAPEQLSNLEYSAASDIYSLGIIFYEMLTGKKAFTEDSASIILEQILFNDLPSPIEVRTDGPDDLNQLVLQMISRHPDQRPSAKKILNSLNKINQRNKQKKEK